MNSYLEKSVYWAGISVARGTGGVLMEDDGHDVVVQLGW